MHASHATALGQQCSRLPYAPTRGFEASEGDLAHLAEDLTKLPQAYAVGHYGVNRAPANFAPTASVMQVVGMELPDGRRRLYLNAFPSFARSCADRPETPCVVCDGGDDFWGVLYDPQRRAFDTLSFNGPA